MDPTEGVIDLKFEKEKSAILQGMCVSECEDAKDKSRKGFFDSEINEFLTFLNSLPNLITTSSCSGRVVLFSSVGSQLVFAAPAAILITILQGNNKGACRWHLVSHSEFNEDLLVEI